MRARLAKRPVLWGGASALILAMATAGGVAAAHSGGSARRAGVASRQAIPPVRHAASSSAGSPVTVHSPAAPAPEPVVNIGSYTGRAPSKIDFSADGGNIVTGIHWGSWTARGAIGHGTSAIESCVPNCAQGPVTYVPATITLSAPLGGEFTVLTETRKGQTITLRYPVSWPLAAS